VLVVRGRGRGGETVSVVQQVRVRQHTHHGHTSRVCSSRPREDGRSDERFGAGARIVRIDSKREAGRVIRRLAIDPPEVFDHIAALGDPFAEILGARAQDNISHRGSLLTLADGASRCRRIPNVADDARAH
jgi:hypothetical protein